MKFTSCGRRTERRPKSRINPEMRPRSCRRAACSAGEPYRRSGTNQGLRIAALPDFSHRNAAVQNAFENGRSSGGFQYPVAASLTPSAATDGASVGQTIIGLKFNGPDLPAGGKVSGSVYMDFFGGTSVPGNSLFRIRTAALDLTWKNTTFKRGPGQADHLAEGSVVVRPGGRIATQRRR